MSDDQVTDVPEPFFDEDEPHDAEEQVTDDLGSVSEPDGSEADRLEQLTTAASEASEDDEYRGASEDDEDR